MGHVTVYFFFMTARPPRSTLFPTRRSSDLRGRCGDHIQSIELLVSASTCRLDFADALQIFCGIDGAIRRQARSEEHTSELQSHVNLVCRLLLEKKKHVTAFARLSA